MDRDDLCYLPAHQLAAAIRAKELSPVEVTEAVLDRIQAVNPRLNAYVILDAEGARAAAKKAEAAVLAGEAGGPLHGVPISVKDLIPVAGLPTTYGSNLFRDFVPPRDALVVERVKHAGAIVLGKTNTPEFGHKGVTTNPVWGETANPWDLSKTPGGSSGGDAAAVAAGLAWIGLGNDGGGSVRIPASFCGLVGIKPTRGRIPQYPNYDSWPGLAYNGPLTRTVRDCALALSVMSGPDARDPLTYGTTPLDALTDLERDIKGLRVAWSADYGYAAVEPETRRIAGEAARAFADLGCQLDNADPGFRSPFAAWRLLFSVALVAPMVERYRAQIEELDPTFAEIVRSVDEMSGLDVAHASRVQTEVRRQMIRFFERWDLLLTPTAAVAPFRLGITNPPAIDGRPVTSRYDCVPFTYPFNLSGHPAVTVPAGWSADGLPIGLQIVGPYGADALVLRAAAAYEQVRPWAGRRPPLQ